MKYLYLSTVLSLTLDAESKPTKEPVVTKVPDTFDVAVEKFETKNAKKGDTAVFKLSLKNAGSKSGKIKLTPYLTAKDYTDYENIRLPSFEMNLNGTENDGGFDQMMNVKTMWKTFDNWRPNQNDMDHILDQASENGKQRLGLKKPFQMILDGRMTHPDNHGYDMEIGLTENGFGGIAWIGGNTQVSGIFDGDTSVGRSQMVLIHETGHNYGSPHCDPIQGFVMCSGEKHDHYTNGEQWFVWHDMSIKEMVKAKDMDKSTFAAFAEDRIELLSNQKAVKIKN